MKLKNSSGNVRKSGTVAFQDILVLLLNFLSVSELHSFNLVTIVNPKKHYSSTAINRFLLILLDTI